MGSTCDIGQINIDVVEAVFETHGTDAWEQDAWGWCYEHDNNMLVGICTLCDEASDVQAHGEAALRWLQS